MRMDKKYYPEEGLREEKDLQFPMKSEENKYTNKESLKGCQ